MEASKGTLSVDLRANIVTSVVVYSLSAEVAVKANLLTEGTKVHQHDLRSLFESISEHNRNKIKKALEEKYPEFDNLLEKYKKSFVEWRYFYEGSQSADLSFLRNFSHELNILCNTIIQLSDS